MDDLKVLVNVQQTIENAFWCYGSPLRNLLMNCLQKKQLYKINQFYEDVHNKLSDPDCFTHGNKWCQKILTLFSMLSIDHSDILEDIDVKSQIDRYCKRLMLTFLGKLRSCNNKSILFIK